MTVNAISSHIGGANDEVTHVSLRELSLPIYDGDLEATDGLPEGAIKLRSMIKGHDALIIGCPEYNGFMTPLLLNAIDWSTRSEEGAPDLSCYRDKPVLLVSTSPGAFAGLRATTHLRTMLSGIGAIVMPDSFSIPASFKAFDTNGVLIDEGQQKRATDLAQRFATFVQRLNG